MAPIPPRTPSYTADWEIVQPHPTGFNMRFGSQDNDEKAIEQNDRFATMSAAASLNRGGAMAFTPKDLELFKASEQQQKSCFRGYDKVTNNPPCHKTLPPWKIDPLIRAKLERGF